MRLVWEDDCSGAAGAPPDPDRWGVRETDRWQSPAERQTYTTEPANACYDGRGHLVITAVRAGTSYTSARLSARHAAQPHLFRYGWFAASIRVPTGAGVWPAWWLLGRDDQFGWPECGEIDIMEAPASPETAGEVHQGTHSPPAGIEATAAGRAVSVGVEPSRGRWGDDFHTYAADWRPGRIDFFVDRRLTGRVTRADVEARGGAWVFDDRTQSPVLNLAVGGWAGDPGQDWSEQSMTIAWVRVYDAGPAI